jgi:ubiquinone/menaquinone biosynthesis C-methylase UbiE
VRKSESFTAGVRRSATLFSKFRTQYEDPDGFYTYLAEDTVRLVGRYESVEGKRVIDVGGGPGYFAKAFRRSGASSCFVEPFLDQMTDWGRSSGLGIVGDGMDLPFADNAFDISHSSNVIEHVLKPKRFFDEMIRVVRPSGLIFLAFTNWLSPFGGHETSPWHYMGGEWAARRYERKLGYAPKNRYGISLYRLDIAPVLSWARNEENADLIDAFPRYYPAWTKGIVQVPGVREIATWNLVLVLRRR